MTRLIALIALALAACSPLAGGARHDDVTADSGAPACAWGEMACGAVCVLTRVDRENCGGCGVVCGLGQFCSAGRCASAPSCGGSAGPTCPAGQSCLAGACCGPDRACGGVCCDASSVCVAGADGALSCARRCLSGANCGASAPCCAMLTGPDGLPTGGGACSAEGSSPYCLCATARECSGGACSPIVDRWGAPVPGAPYVCNSSPR